MPRRSVNNGTAKSHFGAPRLVAIVGAPNVGKSTLFNLLVGDRIAITSSIPRTTRDILLEHIEWNGTRFTILDTAGLDELVMSGSRIRGANEHRGTRERQEVATLKEIEKSSQSQTLAAIEEADVIIFAFDIRIGITPLDRSLARLLRSHRDRVIFVANKAEELIRRGRVDDAIEEAGRIGLGWPIAISAASGQGTGDLLDQVVERIIALDATRSKEETPRVVDATRVMLMGKPNVGKSTLMNSLIGRERSVVTDIPGTTRDMVSSMVTINDQVYQVIDTAGMKRAGRTHGLLEKASLMRSLRALEMTDVVLFLVDGSEPFNKQDVTLSGFVDEAGKPVIIVVNKWDIADASEKATAKLLRDLKAAMPHLAHAPILFISAKTGRNLTSIWPTINTVVTRWRTIIPEERLKEVLAQAIKERLPMKGWGTAFPKIMDIVQVGTEPPTIELRMKDPRSLSEAWLRFLKHKLYAMLDLDGTPIQIRRTASVGAV